MSAELTELHRLAEMMAHEQMTSRPNLHEDAVQEALIAAWQALEAGKPLKLVHSDMRRAVIHLDMGKSMTGNKRSPGRNGVDTHQRYGAPLTRQTEAGEELVVEPSDTATEAALEAVETRVDMEPLVASFSPSDREIVRGVGVLSFGELGRRLNKNPSTVSSRWNQHLRPLLAEALAA